MRHELGHTLLARLGKKRLRPGGIEATNWLLSHINFETSPKILEVACNMGTNMIELAKKYGCHIIGLDQNEQALEKAKENIQKNHLEDVLSVIWGNALHLPFADNSFDIIINEAMLTMLPPHAKEQALSEYQRVLKKGGMLLTHDVCLCLDDKNLRASLVEKMRQVIHTPVYPLTKEEWKLCIEKPGFIVEQKSGEMSLLNPTGLIRDEGIQGAMQIMANGLKKENQEHFLKMFNFFRDYHDKLGYVAPYSIKA